MPIIDITKLKTVEIDRDRMGGMPVLQGTRFPVAQLIAEVAEMADDLSEDFDLDLELVTDFLDELANQFDPKFNPALRAYLKTLKRDHAHLSNQGSGHPR